MGNLTALVTGASGGLGYAIAELLGAKKFDLVVVSRSVKKLETMKIDFQKRWGITVTVIAADLASPKGAQSVFDACQKKKITIDILVNNAGSGLFGENMDQKIDDVTSMIRLNINALTELCMLFGKAMKERGSGRILNIASLVGTFAVPFFSVYAATKAFVISYSRSLRSELRPAGVSVSVFLPGYIKTGFDDNAGVASEGYKKISGAAGMSAQKVARSAVKTVLAGRALAVAGLTNRIGYFVMKIIPKQILSHLVFVMMRNVTKR
ncbi:MAG: SDR family NAD(P)-dependent oxidoreductase [Spirochaetes bacterium]|nr:SDR family NAD(P)-dependent oxidoreductase [Spirochaetota bacterium]